ncbi:MAG TPA: hypothetical protein VKV73_15635 [Chloroflexota bacterium]|nr:hypothetical protein [Chloroflexota bacterium]
MGEVIATTAAPGDQTRIGAAGKRAYQITRMTISTQLRGGSDVDENQCRVLGKPAIPREELTNL